MPAPAPDPAGTDGPPPSVRLTGLVQGLVIGDHNTVTQHFHQVRHERVVAREAPSLPAFWVDRPALVEDARARLASEPASVVALVGMGGSGKSRLAARIAGALEAEFTGGCFWLDMAGSDLDVALLRIALAFGHDLSALPSRGARAATVRSLLAGQRVLLVLDGVVRPDDATDFLPPPPSCAALLTTRNDALASALADHVITVPPLAPDDAVALLAGAAGASPAEPFLAAVAERLGGLPLALELAGRLARQQQRRPGFDWAVFAERLADAAARLDVGLVGRSVRAAFDATWQRALDDAMRDAFARLGLFEPRDLSTAEVAAAWGRDDAAAIDGLNALVDLSLLQWVDPVTVRLHPLLHDYAAERALALDPALRRAVHARVADHHLARAPYPPRTMAELSPVLHAHWHAAAAGDAERARRAYPWFGDSAKGFFAVPGFLIDHGQFTLRLKHQRLVHALAQALPAWARAVEERHLADALVASGQHAEAAEHLETAIRLLDSPDVDDDARRLSLGATLTAAGQAHAAAGDLAAAEAALRRAIEWDRRLVTEGGVVGAGDGLFITQLQLADLQRQRGDRDAAYRTCHDTLEQAVEAGCAHPAVMALERLAAFDRERDPTRALHWLRLALQLHEQQSSAFSGRQGARYARQLGETAVAMALAGQPAIDEAQRLLALAIRTAGTAGAASELGLALYRLGHLFEHQPLLGRAPALGAAWACYARADAVLRDVDGGSAVPAAMRIETRIVPRLDEPERAATAEAVARDPWQLIDAALAPLALGWRPTAATASSPAAAAS